MFWDGLLAHHGPLELMRQSLRSGRLAHTYLFAGPSGVGKGYFARRLAQALLCQRCDAESLEACEQCPSCHQMKAGTHPDLLTVACPPGKSELPVELLVGSPDERGRAGLCFGLSLSPMIGARKIAIIDDADLLNPAGANALLKTLEEPPAHSILILLATSPEVLLSTIRSRCQVVHFGPLAETDVARLLVKQELVEAPAEAAEVAKLSRGSLTVAKSLIDPALREHREKLYTLLARHPFPMVELAETMTGAASAAGSEASEQRRVAAWLIDFCREFYRQTLRELCRVDSPAPGLPVDAEPPAPVRQFATRLRGARGVPTDVVTALLERVIKSHHQLDRMLSISLVLEALADDLSRLQRTTSLS